MLSDIATQIGGEIFGSDIEISEFSTDTRSLVSGDLYLALTGQKYDGNKFVNEAIKKGAAAAIVSENVDAGLPIIKVSDVHLALGKIAAIVRQRSKVTLVAITGSQGKTTVKEMVGLILGDNTPTLITQGNQNNTIGVPLTLLRLQDHHEYAVIEMGGDCHGEIEFSAAMSKPDIALITNANAAHIEGFGSLQGIVEAKGEIIDPTVANGRIILNADDANVKDWIERAGSRKVIQFSDSNSEATYFASDAKIGSEGQVSFVLNTPINSQLITLNLLGKHNIINAVAAAAASIEAGADLSQVEHGLKRLKPVPGRLNLLFGINRCRILDDTYNASPASFKAAIDVLMSFSGEKILIAGDMRELGSEATQFHIEIGKYAAEAGVQELWAIGELSEFTVKGFGSTGKHFTSKEELISACKLVANKAIVFLVKGSRSAQMDAVVKELSVNGGD